MSTVDDYIQAMDDDDLTFRRMSHGLLTGEVGRAVEGMTKEAEKDEPFEVIDFKELMRGVHMTPK